MRRAPQLLRFGLVALLLAACSGPPTPSVTVDPAASADGLLDGVPGDCRLLAEHDPELHERLLTMIDAGVDHGPLVVGRVGGIEVIGATTYESRGVQGRSAAWMADDGDPRAVNEEAARISSAPVAVPTTGDEIMAAIAEAEDCSWVAADRSVEDPPEAEPEMRPDLLVIEPATAAPGTEVALRFPEETSRGIAFQLDRRTADGWETTHWMSSDGNGDQYAETVPAGAEGHAVIDVGVGGPGPDHVRLPEDVPPGEYRICTANAGDEFCAPLTIMDG